MPMPPADPGPVPPLDTPQGRRDEFRRLLGFAEESASGPGGPFAYLDDVGEPDESQGWQLWITARMTHVFALAHMLGEPDAGLHAGAGVSALTRAFRDPAHGGWFGHLDGHGHVLDERKSMYEHAFVLLAASTATTAGVDGATDLLSDVVRVVDDRFWDDDAGACRESWDRAWSVTEDYRGANSNMHAVEAFLAAGQVTGDRRWSRRALRIAERLVHHEAAARSWRLPEHYTRDWQVVPDYNRDQPRHRFRPYGVTIGHLLEWSRLLVHLEAALDEPPRWLLDDATALFRTALDIGWEADGSPGFVYTVDWNDRPVVAERMHWVAAEAAMTANILGRRTGEAVAAEWEPRLWRNLDAFVDPEHGSWHHELDARGEVSRTVWSGKPDVYHALQAVLLPEIPVTPSLAASVALATRG
jgi:sulfoquinovose isomerase